MTSRARLVSIVAAALVAATLSGCEPPPKWHNELVSVDAAGTGPGNASSYLPVFSPDGTKIAFGSDATNLTAGSSGPGLYVRDLVTGTTSLVSVTSSGTNGNSFSQSPVFSPDSTKIAFHSYASNLVPGDTNGHPDVFVRDLVAGTTSLVSVNAAGTGPANGDSFFPVFSPDASKIAFDSRATDLAPIDENIAGDRMFVRDLGTGTTTFVAVFQGGGGRLPVFSPDGTKIAFHTDIEMALPDRDGANDVFVRDLVTDEVTLVSVNAAGDDSGNGASSRPVFSPDGTEIAFVSTANDFGPADGSTCFEEPNRPFTDARCRDIYIRDLASGTTTLVSANGAGTDSGNDLSWNPQFSSDGDRVLFQSYANNLGPTDSDRGGTDNTGDQDVYIRDLASGTTTLVSANAAGTDSGNTVSDDAHLSPDGRRVAFISGATDLGPATSQTGWRVFVRDLATNTTSLVSANADGDDAGNGESTVPVWGPSSRVLAFVSEASDLLDPPLSTPGRPQIYLATLPEADLSVALDATPDPVASGGGLTYTVEVANAGPDPASDVEAGLLLPEGTTFVDATATAGTCADPEPAHPRSVVCQLGDLDESGGATVTVTAHVTAPTGTTLSALALVRSPTLDSDASDNAPTLTTDVS